MHSHHRMHSGFTLIELIVVIVILGVLIAAALPKFMALRADAAVASLKGLEGSVRSASQLLNAQCQLKPSCNPSALSSQASVEGRSIWVIYGWPEAGDLVGQNQIDVLVKSSGFSVSMPNFRTHRWSLNSSQTPALCYVDYVHPMAVGTIPAISAVTIGC